MDLFSMQCFLSVAENLNLSKAAMQMNITQPAMSVQMKKLEKEIGATLFERSSRKWILTPAGQMVRKTFASMIGAYNVLLWQVKVLDADAKCLRIGYHGPSDWAGILGLFHLFLQENPGIRITIHQGEFGELAKKLERGELDLAFLETSDLEERDILKWVPLFDDYGCFAVAKEHPLAGKKRVEPKEIENQKIYFNLRSSASMQSIFRKLIQSGIDPDNLICVEGTGTSVALALAYGGMAALPMNFKEGNSQAVYVDYSSPVVHMYFGLAWRKDNEMKELKQFVHYSQNYEWPQGR